MHGHQHGHLVISDTVHEPKLPLSVYGVRYVVKKGINGQDNAYTFGEGGPEPYLHENHGTQYSYQENTIQGSNAQPVNYLTQRTRTPPIQQFKSVLSIPIPDPIQIPTSSDDIINTSHSCSSCLSSAAPTAPSHLYIPPSASPDTPPAPAQAQTATDSTLAEDSVSCSHSSLVVDPS